MSLLPMVKITSLVGTVTQMDREFLDRGLHGFVEFLKFCTAHKHVTFWIHQVVSVLMEAHICLCKLKLDKTEHQTSICTLRV